MPYSANTLNNTYSKMPVQIYFLLMYLYCIINVINTHEIEGGGILNQIIAGFIILYCICFSTLSNKPAPIHGKGLYRVLLFFLVYIVARIGVMFLSDVKLAAASVRNSLTIIFWITNMLFCIKQFRLTKIERLDRLVIVLIVFSFAYFLYSTFVVGRYYNDNDEIGAVNAAGSAYMMVPLILLMVKGKAKYVIYLICLVICAWSQKRQALLGFTIVSFFVIIDMIKAYFKSFKVVGAILLFIALLSSSFIVSRVFSGIIERQQHLEEKGDIDSGRNVLRLYAVQGFLDADLFDEVFGGGPAAGQRYIDQGVGFSMMPHCGFIEVLCDYGIVGIALYILFFISIFRFAQYLPRGSLARKLIWGILLSWIMLNIISHAGNVWLMFYCIAIGCVINLERFGDNRIVSL